MILRKINFPHRGIQITGADDNDPKEHITRDLHVGSRYFVPGNATPIAIQDPITLHPGKCLSFETMETIQLPKNIFGLMCSKGSLNAQGIVVGNTKVDPFFEGRLIVPVFNTGSRSVEIIPSQPFCSLVFFQVEADVPSDARRTPISPAPQTKRRRGAEFWESNKEYIYTVIICTVITLIGTFSSCHSTKLAAATSHSSGDGLNVIKQTEMKPTPEK